MATPSAPGTLATAPLRAEAFVGRLEAAGFDVFTGVPCSLIEDVIAVLEHHPRLPYVAAPREDLAVAVRDPAQKGKAGASYDPSVDRSLDVHVSRLRQKLEDDPKEPRFIKTVRGIGYVLARPS